MVIMIRRSIRVAKGIGRRADCRVRGRVDDFRLDGQAGQDEQLFETPEK